MNLPPSLASFVNVLSCEIVLPLHPLLDVSCITHIYQLERHYFPPQTEMKSQIGQNNNRTEKLWVAVGGQKDQIVK
jgi:hypothetical protein